MFLSRKTHARNIHSRQLLHMREKEIENEKLVLFTVQYLILKVNIFYLLFTALTMSVPAQLCNELNTLPLRLKTGLQ